MSSTDVSWLSGRLQQAFTTVGFVGVLYVTLRVNLWVFRFVRAYVLSGTFQLHTNVKNLGKWAAVTGCTDGIGKAYAEELASKGLNIVLLSRSQEKLERVAKEIETTSKVQTKIIIVDFTDGPGVYENIEREVAGLEIGVLVNNVGMTSRLDRFLKAPNLDKYITDIINVNVLAATHMTRILLPAMVQRQKGAIINISSGSGKIPTPLLTVYSSTKGYLDFFSRALHTEYESKGIIVQSVMPYFVSTNMTHNANTSLILPSAKNYVKQSLATLGIENRTHGYFSHTIQGLPFDVVPTTLAVKFMYLVMKYVRSYDQSSRDKEKTT
ncbi:very-long-chain 3-oxoacyl-CoA reductase-like [Ptychodera flava]|uniref:very-long-chain 3-oxoacyl-CoA reductase-like n=1 Tax=Ptychodera flava TaxID=63121 RepID=UPI00396A977B